ncbi:MAG TPA: peptidase domain-containing ABC transporter [Azospirillum sp.]
MSAIDTASRRTGLWCLTAIARFHGIDLSEEQLLHTQALEGKDVDLRRLAKIAQHFHFRTRIVGMSWDELVALGDALPAVLPLRDHSYAVLSGVRTDGGEPEIVVRNPLAPQGGFEFWNRETAAKAWAGDVLLLKRRFRLGDTERRFGLAWFAPEILRQRRILADVVLAAFVLHFLGLAVPIFFQLVIDKVVIHHAYATLTALATGVCGAVAFEALLSFLRSFLLLQATAKIDIRISTRVFAHLLSLPIDFFERSSAGVLTNHVQQDRTIREFLTGRLFLTALDSTALLISLPIIFFYSVPLALTVLGFTGLIAAIIAVVASRFRQRLQDLYKAEAGRQALLVETIHGIGTVKALALEPQHRRQWDTRSADAVERHLSVGRLSATARSVSALLEKLMVISVIWIGVRFVFDGSMSVGELVAVQMFAGRVSGPLLQLITIIQDYQQVAVSVRMLGEVMNTAPEMGMSRGLQPKLRGGITFEDVGFKYPTAVTPALADIRFAIPPGAVLGIVGRSGSGKSTLIRLLQGLHSAQGGNIRIDGFDLRDIDRVHLRRNIGVVLQENFLFRGTVRENITLTKPEARFEEVVNAAQLAGADEFIQRLPHGYDTHLEEGAVNLSGGQRQRLAIARALLRQPTLLILDEATSALDPESEMIVQRNMKAIAQGRTTLIISHRLSTIRHADRIMVLDQGRMVGFGPHDALLEECEMYRQLWNLQTESFR